MPKWLTRLLTTSKHVDPAVAAVEKPVLDAAHTAVTSTVAAATVAIDPAVDEAVAAADALADAYLAKLGVVGAALTPAAHVGVAMGAAAIIGALQSKLGLQPGDMVPKPA